MSETATLTRVPGALRTAAMTLAADDGQSACDSSGYGASARVGAGFFARCWSPCILAQAAQMISAAKAAEPGRMAQCATRCIARPTVNADDPCPRARRAARRRRAVRLRGALRQVARLVAGRHRARPHDDRRGGARHPAPARRASGLRFDVRLIANGVVLALHWVSVLRRDPGRRRGRSGLLGFASFPLFVLLARARRCSRGGCERREALTALLVTAGLVLLVPELSLAQSSRCRASRWGLVSGFTFALLAVLNRRWAANANAPPTSRSGRTSSRRSCCCRSRGRRPDAHRPDRRARDHAAARAGPRLHGARAHAVHRGARRRHRAHRERRRGAGAGVRHRAGARCCWAKSRARGRSPAAR